jgi:hypothetical protein
MLGDAAPKVQEQRDNAKNANRGRKQAGGSNGKAVSNGKSGGNGTDKTSAKPPLAKSGGRATPPGSRSSASRKKKKRK